MGSQEHPTKVLSSFLHVCKLLADCRSSQLKKTYSTVKSTYDHLCKNIVGPNYTFIWKARLPLKIKIFLWQLFLNSVLTKDNMVKRAWPGNAMCLFCHKDETLVPLFFDCTVAKCVWGCIAYTLGTDFIPQSLWQYFVWVRRFLPGLKTIFVEGLGAVCWAIWKTRNAVCFERKVVHHPTSVVFLLFLRYWAELQKNQTLRQGMMDGAAGLLQATVQLRRRHQATRQATEASHHLVAA